MRILTSIIDPVKAPEYKSDFISKLFVSLIRDPRDLPFVFLSLKITFFMIPLGIMLYFPLDSYIWWAIAIAYFIFNNFIYKGPFGLMLHCTSHRRFFKKKFDFFNHYIPWVIGPFFGQTPETYFSHHLGMHHLENNLEEDLSSTMQYQRDSFLDFSKYFFNFLFIGFIETIKYFDIRNLKTFRNKIIRGESVFILGCILLAYLNLAATLWVFVLPFFLSRIIMMVGNWAQHSFVDYHLPGNCYKNSINCINTNYNIKCWNDGYHIDHHLKPAMHWTEYPLHFQENISEFAKNKALVFEGIHFLHVWFYLMTKKYNKLAEHIVNLEGMFSSEDDAIALMKERTRQMPKRGISAKSLKLRNAMT